MLNPSMRGFTLVELLVGISLLAMLLALGMPSMSQYIQNNKISSAASNYYAGLQLARTEAIRSNVPVEFVLTNGTGVAAAPAIRGAWLLGLLLCLLFAVLGVVQGAPNGSLLFLALTPLVPVAAVGFAYGQDVDPMWDTTLAAPYAPLRLLLLRSVSVVVVAPQGTW